MKGRGCLAAVLTGLTAFGLMLGCDRIPGKPTEAQRPLISSQVRNFDDLYGRSCTGCHGGDGQMGAARPLRDRSICCWCAAPPCGRFSPRACQARRCRPSPIAWAGGLTDTQIDLLIDGIQNRWGGRRPSEPDAPFL